MKPGAKSHTGRMLEIKPTTIGTLCLLGRKTQSETRDEIPKTAPLWTSRPDEPWKSSSAPKEVWTGVNIVTRKP